ncbi:hypothetical protein AcW1_004617 [Taiwanofungus camphoratus]|nr:hypothetical protein AcW2_006379 [Antrodia cinnamomea]KAI0939664.1 hypothetical protein AcV5_001003 [Antrodia cinnamomea]KAI0959949.1 hypothetical protein AcW1_004617 [Antrodia cinnamomea]
MPGAKLPSVRLPTVVAGQGVVEEALGDDGIAVELPSSRKFGFAWPAEPPPPVTLPLTAERPAGVQLSSSEGETDVSEDELSHPVRRATKPEEGDESEFVTPTNHLNSDQNPMDQGVQLPALPRFSRAFSMPLPSQLESLRNPRRASSPGGETSPTVIELPPEFGHFQELSLELADSVQMVIQTLLQLSPPQVLDPAKEQFSACSLSIPTPSISAMFTSMKNLNYMSANMSALSLDPPMQQASDSGEWIRTGDGCITRNDFDVGEMLQSVGDVLSGVAAQAGVDLALFHGDLGMKHVAVKGDESGISFALSHVVRQVISTASRGDTVEIGLFIESARTFATVSDSGENSRLRERSSSPITDVDGPLRCTFHIAHRFSAVESAESNNVDAFESDSVPQSPSLSSFARPQPCLKTLFLRRLLRHIGASLEADVRPQTPSVQRPYELTVILDRGSPFVVDPGIDLPPEDAACLDHPEFRIAHEPTLQQLTQFAESLRGKKVTLFAHPKGAFAQHLTSYLTTWGLDVSHVSTEPGAESEHGETSPEAGTSSGPGRDGSDVPSQSTNTAVPAEPYSFVLIDDDVEVLRSKLQKIRAEQAYPLNLHNRKRPSLATNHRPRSSPQVTRVVGFTPSSASFTQQVVLVHFTSLSHFKMVKDIVQSVLNPNLGPSFRLPECIVIPKPAGPRRVLTALHTAVTKPVVDPFFSPIATSPISPGFHTMSPFFNVPGAAKSPGGRSTASIRTASDRSAKSPKEHMGDSSNGASSPRAMSDGMEYFSDTVTKLGPSPASGLVIQSPDGQPAGIVFHPKAKRSNASSPTMERSTSSGENPGRSRGVSLRRTSDNDKNGLLAHGGTDSVRRGLRPQTTANADSGTEHREPPEGIQGKGKGRQVLGDVDILPIGQGQGGVSPGAIDLSPSEPPSSQAGPRINARRNVHIDPLLRHASDPPPPPSRAAGPAIPHGRRGQRRANADNPASPALAQKKGKGLPETNIVPPISVLIVDDNPINQTILSTFMQKKKIKFDVAKNGEEAVAKWRSGGFHLILMDIQMPVMDGIQATKEIRRIEKLNAAGGFPSSPQSEGQRTPSDVSTTGSSATTTPSYRSSVIIVALTASSLQSDRVTALAAGCNDFLTKPVSLHWLNSKIIEWGSIKALQMWADIRPEVVKSISHGQAAQAQNVARRLHVPEGRSTPTGSRSRSSSLSKTMQAEGASAYTISTLRSEKTVTPNTPVHGGSPGASRQSYETANMRVSTLPSAVSGSIAESEILPENANARHSEGSLAELVQNRIEAVQSAGDMVIPSDTMRLPDVSESAQTTIIETDSSERPATASGSLDGSKDIAPSSADESAPPGHDGQPPPPPPPEPQ